MKRTRKQLKQTAYHEGGHAVIGRVLTLPCGHATIKPNYEEGEAGYAITPDPYLCSEELRKRGKVRDMKSIYLARIIVYMAGAETEQELLLSKGVGDEFDRKQIGLMAEEISGGDCQESCV